MRDGSAVAEAGYLEIQCSEPGEAALKFHRVVTHGGRPKPHLVLCGVGREQHPAVPGPQEGQLPGAVARDVDGLDAASHRQHLPVHNLVLDLAWLNRRWSGLHHAPEDREHEGG